MAHVRVDADAGWETMPIPPGYEHVPSAGVAAGNPDADRETMPIPPDCKHVPGSGITAGVADAGRETITIPPDYTRIRDAGFAACAPGPDQETMSIPPDCERVPGNSGDAGDLFVVRFYVDGSVLVGVRSFQDGRRLRCMIESLALDHLKLLGPRGPRDSPLLEAQKLLGWSTRLEVLGWVLDTDRLTFPCRPARALSFDRFLRTGRIVGTLPFVSR